MSSKLCKNNYEDVKLPNLGKEILEIKKRIQLSEGQRKALLEEMESQTKRDTEEVQRLKHDIATTTMRLYEQRNNALVGLMPLLPPAKPSSAPCKRVTSQTSIASRAVVTAHKPEESLKLPALRSMLGNSMGRKSLEEIINYLDLQRIDKCKQMDLLNYRFKQKSSKLKQMATEYQKLLLNENAPEDEAIEEDEAKGEQIAKDYRNRMNAMRVQIKEAQHVQTRYKDIKWKLHEDASKFQSKMCKIQEDLKQQHEEIAKIKQVHQEAVTLRAEARNALQREEKQVLAGNATREKQSTEGKRLLEARNADLEKLERYIYHTKPREEITEDVDSEDLLDEDEEPPLDPEQELKEQIEVLKDATGSSCIEEVLTKVQGQTTTQVRLMTLRKTKENVKNAKQKKFEQLTNELEHLKFSENKQTQQNVEDADEVKIKTQAYRNTSAEYAEKVESIQQLTTKIVDKLLNAYLCLCQDDDNDGMYRIETPNELLLKLIERIKQLRIRDAGNENATIEELLEELNEREAGNWLPGAYNDIIRRTPIPSSSSPVPAQSATAMGASEDEDEIPTRGFLKRQAQLVVDAKNKRKTMRFPIPKTK